MQKVAVLILAMFVVAAVATEVDTEVDAEKRGKKTVTRPVAGNATTRRVRRFATRFALAQNVRCNANRLNALNVPSTANNRSVRFVARKTCARKTRARNARLCVPRPSATPLVSPRKRIAHLSVKRRRVRGHALNRRPARAQNVSSNAPNRRVTLKTNSVVANVTRKVSNAL